jgi:hypothetical protein
MAGYKATADPLMRQTCHPCNAGIDDDGMQGVIKIQSHDNGDAENLSSP